MKVLSLYDGISCGRVALERAGIQIVKTIIFMTSFLIIFGGVFSIRYLMSLQLNIDISLLTTISLAILIIIMLIIFLCIRKNMVNEKIILSLKE